MEFIIFSILKYTNTIISLETFWYIPGGIILACVIPVIVYKPTRVWLKQQWNFNRLLKAKPYMLILVGLLLTLFTYFLMFQEEFLYQLNTFSLNSNVFFESTTHYFATPTQSWLFILGLCILTPIGEEVFYRGVIMKFLVKRYNFLAGILASSVLFGIMHFNGLQMLIFLFIFALIQGSIVHYSKTLIPAIIVHGLWNLFVVIFITHEISVYQLNLW